MLVAMNDALDLIKAPTHPGIDPKITPLGRQYKDKISGNSSLDLFRLQQISLLDLRCMMNSILPVCLGCPRLSGTMVSII
jgi:hypothetical protein